MTAFSRSQVHILLLTQQNSARRYQSRLQSSFQRVVFPVEASLNRLLWNRSISPNSLLETSISEEVRPRDLEEEEATQSLGPLLPPTTTSRRHTLAEVSTRFHQCNPPC